MSRFTDGLTNIINKLANRRSAVASNVITADKLQDHQLREIYRTGLGSKIVRIKTGYALNDTLHFKSDQDRAVYEERLERSVKKAAKFMLGFGRGIILINERGADHSTLATTFNMELVKLDVFSGDMVSVQDVSRDLDDSRYQKPRLYSVNGKLFHYTRVVDFTYYMPVEQEMPNYQFGGVSEFELIHAQMVNDGIVERASGTIVEKNATLFHKVRGFKDAVRCGDDDALVQYYAKLGDLRSIYGDGLIDAEDDVINVAQALTNLADVDQITLRRLALVTSIPLPILIGESVKGLNSTGSQERQSFQDMTENLQFDYLQDPIRQLCRAFGIEGVKFKENQGGTALERLDFESKAIENAMKLDALGEDYRPYLEELDIIKADPWAESFKEVADDDVEGAAAETAAAGGEQASIAQVSMNGAQVASLVEVLEAVAAKTMPPETAKEVIASAFPIDAEVIDRMVAPMVAIELPEPEVPATGAKP
jgi:hypothetical protein